MPPRPPLLKRRHVAISDCRRGLFIYNHMDEFVGTSLALYGEWCDFELLVLSRFIAPGDIVIDIGANVGTHTVAFAEMVGPSGRVFAFEPQRSVFYLLAGNVALNGLTNVFCHQMAVGNEIGTITVPLAPAPHVRYNYGGVRLRDKGERVVLMHGVECPDSITLETVPITKVDAIETPSCRAIKIDVEGMEIDVLRGAMETIERCRPVLYLECGDKKSATQIGALLEHINYVAWWSIYPHYDPENFFGHPIDVWPAVVPAANLLCAPRDMAVDMSDHEPFMGGSDDWRACLRRAAEREQTS